jgi:hypothetical protein
MIRSDGFWNCAGSGKLATTKFQWTLQVRAEDFFDGHREMSVTAL